MNPVKTRVGLFGIGLDTYWPQFAGLRDRLVGYQNEIASGLSGLGAEVCDAGLVDTPIRRAPRGIFSENRKSR